MTVGKGHRLRVGADKLKHNRPGAQARVAAAVRLVSSQLPHPDLIVGLLLAGGVALDIALAQSAEGELAFGIVVGHPVAAFGLRLFLAALRRLPLSG